MESVVVVPLRVGGKKMKKRRELDALVAHSLAKRLVSSNERKIFYSSIFSFKGLVRVKSKWEMASLHKISYFHSLPMIKKNLLG